MAITNKDLEINIKAKYDGSGTKTATMDLKKFADAAVSSSAGVNSAFSKISGGMSSISSVLKNVGSSFLSAFGGIAKSAIEGVYNMLPSLSSMLMGLAAGVYEGAKAFIELNAGFEKMKITLDVVTKGHGEEWFNKLNQWALNMPISIQEVTKSFITMQAYGLNPTMEMMKAMVNVASVFPESSKAMSGIARALGQIQSKGRLEGQELRQLAEWAIPGYEAVYKKIFLNISKQTGKSVEELKFTMVDSATAIKAILETMEEHFGGSATRISKGWYGMSIRLTNYIKEFFREVGESGAMKPLEDAFSRMIGSLEASFKSGRFQAIASSIGSVVGDMIKGAGEVFKIFTTGGKGDVGSSAKATVRIAVAAFYELLKFIAYIPTAWNNVHSALISAVGTFADTIRSLISPLVEWYKFLDTMPNIPVVDILGADFEKNKKVILGLDTTLEKISNDLAENKYKVDQNADEWKKKYIEVGKVLDGLKMKSDNTLKSMGEVFGPPKPPENEEVYGPQRIEQPQGPKFGPEKPDWLGIAESGTFLEKMRASFALFEQDVDKKILKNLKKYFADFFGALQSGWSTAIGNMLSGTMTLSQGLHSMFQTIKQAFVNTIADMTAKWMVNKAIMLTKEIIFQKTLTTITAAGEGSRLALEGIASVKGTVLKTQELISHIVHEKLKTGATAVGVGTRLALDTASTHTGLILDTQKLVSHITMEKGKTVTTAEGESERLIIQVGAALQSIAISVATAIKQITIYAYQAAAAVYNAFAFIPFIGPVLGVAAVAGTIALIMGFAAKIAGFETGTGLTGVPSTGPAIVHKGEIIMNKKESDMFRTMMQGNNGASASNINLNFTISAMDSDSLEHIVRKKVIPLIRDNIKDFGKGRTMIKEALA